MKTLDMYYQLWRVSYTAFTPMQNELDSQLLSKGIYDRIGLPTAGLSLHYLRELFARDKSFRAGKGPGTFETPRGPEKEQFFCLEDEARSLDVMYSLERAIVNLAYASVLGGNAETNARKKLESFGLGDGIPGAIEDYTNWLIYYGLADGPNTAKHIITRLEQAAKTIAREDQGRTIP